MKKPNMSSLMLALVIIFGLGMSAVALNSQAASPGYWEHTGICGWNSETQNYIWCTVKGSNPLAVLDEGCDLRWGNPDFYDPCIQLGTEGSEQPFSYRVLDHNGDELVASFIYCGPRMVFDDTTRQCIPSTEPDSGEDCSDDANHGNPISIFKGNKFHRETDYVGSGNYPITFERFYNSNSGSWTYLPSLSLGNSEVTIRTASGKYSYYSSYINDKWVAPPKTKDKLESVVDSFGERTGWKHYLFSQDAVEEYDLQGRITKLTTRSGAIHNYSYSINKVVISSSEGDSLELNFDVNNRLISIIDMESNQTSYAYNARGLISGVTYPDGASKIYHYEDLLFPDALTGITNENGHRYATWGYDDQGRAASSQHGSGIDLTTIDYSHEDDETDPRIAVSNALGKQTIYHFTYKRGLRLLSQVEGVPSVNCLAANRSYTYSNWDANVWSKTDWQGNVTRYTRNTKGQELSRIEAEGTPEERTITTEWHATFNLPTKITESGKETTFTYDVNGNQLSKVVTDIAAP